MKSEFFGDHPGKWMQRCFWLWQIPGRDYVAWAFNPKRIMRTGRLLVRSAVQETTTTASLPYSLSSWSGTGMCFINLREYKKPSTGSAVIASIVLPVAVRTEGRYTKSTTATGTRIKYREIYYNPFPGCCSVFYVQIIYSCTPNVILHFGGCWCCSLLRVVPGGHIPFYTWHIPLP